MISSGARGEIGVRSGSPDVSAARDTTGPHHDRPIRVLILIPSLNVGGAEMDLVRTLPSIDRNRFQVTVCTFLERGELGPVLQGQGIDLIGPLSASLYPFRQFVRGVARRLTSLLKWLPLSSSLGGITYLMDVVRLARPIAKYIRAAEIDVVHTVLPNSYLVGACASALAGRRPILMSRVSLNLYQQDYRLIDFIERRILHRNVDAAIGNSNAVLRDLRSEGIAESKLHLVHNGISARAFTSEMVERSAARLLLGISDAALVFSVVANLHPYKGHRDLLPALAALSHTWPSDWLCLVVGKDVDGQLAELKRLCASYGLSRNVQFLGPRRDIPVVLSASDVHISASHQEGLPNNIIEAMCARLPVVATAVGGVPELVLDGATGYLVPPRDVHRMTGALAALAQAPIRRKAFGEAGYARVMSHFSVDSNVVAFESIYAGLVGGRPHDRNRRSRSRTDVQAARL